MCSPATPMIQKGILKKSTCEQNGVCTSSRSSTVSVSSHVTFDNITVRGYDRVIGDNPACSSGCPISIGWGYSSEITVPFEDYESYRPKSRTKSQMHIPPSSRIGILQDWDFSLSSIVKASREVEKDRNQRLKTTRSVVRRELIGNAIRGVWNLPVALCAASRQRDHDRNHDLDYSTTRTTSSPKHGHGRKDMIHVDKDLVPKVISKMELDQPHSHSNSSTRLSSNSDISLSDDDHEHEHELGELSESFSHTESEDQDQSQIFVHKHNHMDLQEAEQTNQTKGTARTMFTYDDDDCSSISDFEDDGAFSDGLSITHHRHNISLE